MIQRYLIALVGFVSGLAGLTNMGSGMIQNK